MNYLIRRILIYCGVFFVTTQLIFILPRLVPGTAAQELAGSNRFPAQETALLIKRFGLNQPMVAQYAIYMKDLFLTWPPYLGISFEYNTPVAELIMSRVGWTALLIVTSFTIATAITYLVVAIGSTRRGGKFELGSLYSLITVHAIPLYWTAMILLWVFAASLKWFPMFGNVNPTATGTGYVLSMISHAILPIAAMTLAQLGANFLLLRGSTQEVLKSDYVTAAKTRGLGNGTVASRYVLRNSLLPYVSVLSFSTAILMSMVVIVEVVFGYTGIGDLMVDGILARDYPVIQGSFLFIMLIVIVGGFVGDLLLVRLDPRLRR